METVNISRLKAKLTFYLRKVRQGAMIQVLDRTIPIAVIQGVKDDNPKNASGLGVDSDRPTGTLQELRKIWELPSQKTRNDIVKTLLADRLSRF